MKTGITGLELHEYFQNGCIRVKDTMMDIARNGKYVYYEQEPGQKSYHSIDFEEEFDFYRMHGRVVYSDLLAQKYVHPEYGLVIVENHHENYLIDLRENEYVEQLARLSRRRGYRTEIVGEMTFVCIWKNMKE